MCWRGTDIQTAVATAGGIPPLLALMSSSSSHAKEATIGAIVQLANKSRSNQDAISRAGGIPMLVGALSTAGSIGVSGMSMGRCIMRTGRGCRCRHHPRALRYALALHNDAAVISLGKAARQVQGALPVGAGRAWCPAPAAGRPPPQGDLRRICNVCRGDCTDLPRHPFYHQLCPRCAELNWAKRQQTADLSGHVAVVTGGASGIGNGGDGPLATLVAAIGADIDIGVEGGVNVDVDMGAATSRST